MVKLTNEQFDALVAKINKKKEDAQQIINEIKRLRNEGSEVGTLELEYAKLVSVQKDIAQLEHHKLIQQIGNYGCAHQAPCIGTSGNAIKTLYEGINEFNANHLQKVNEHKKANGIPVNPHTLNDPEYFRKALIDYIHEHDLPHFAGVELERETNPESATITMEKLLGPEGVKLYRLALEEEVNSREYRHAVLVKSTIHLDGPKWKERPVVIVAGPSGCGKSFGTKVALDMANKFLPTVNDDNSGNYVIAVDGGLCRATSQMRKLLVQVATNQGYSGVLDLHNESTKSLDEIKERIQEAAFESPDTGVAIPETFKNWFPGNSIRDLMPRIEKMPNTKLIFTRVEGEDYSYFQKIVRFMASRRAWKVQDFMPQSLDLNIEKISESKKYPPAGFYWGRRGSILAEKWFRTHSKDKLSLIITNELILLKPAKSGTSQWIPAQQGDEGADLFPKTAYEEWVKLPNTSSKLGLKAYCDKHSKPIIATSAQVDFAIAQKQLAQRVLYVNKLITQENIKVNTDHEELSKLIAKRSFLEKLANCSIRDLNQEQVAALKHDIQIYIEKTSDGKGWFYTRFDKTLNILNDAISALENVAKELELIEPIPPESKNKARLMRESVLAIKHSSDEGETFTEEGRLTDEEIRELGGYL